MANSNLPALLRNDAFEALAAGDVSALLALHRATFGDARMDADADADAKAAADKAAADAKASADAAAATDKGGDIGFPANTPVEQMTADQRVNYWKHQARKHEDRVKSFDGLTPEQLKDLRDKATKHDQLERELMSDKDKAVAQAADDAKAAALAGVTPKLVRAEFKAALVGRIPAEHLEDRLTAIVDTLDLSKFVNDSGDVDTDKVSKFVEGIAPDKGNSTSTTRRGPSATGHGTRTDSSTAGGSVASGRDLYRDKHRRKSA